MDNSVKEQFILLCMQVFHVRIFFFNLKRVRESAYIVHADFIYVQFPVVLKLDLRVVMRTLTGGAWPPTEAATQALLNAGVGDHQHISCFVIDHICNAQLFSIIIQNKIVLFIKERDILEKEKAYKILHQQVKKQNLRKI